MPAAIMDNSSDVNSIDKVDCTSAEANQKVVGIVSGKKREEATPEAATEMCAPYTTAESYVWIGEVGKAGSVFCLEPVKK
jgi:hypothetical protein